MAPSVHTESGKHGGGSDTNALGTPLPPLRVEFTGKDDRWTFWISISAPSDLPHLFWIGSVLCGYHFFQIPVHEGVQWQCKFGTWWVMVLKICIYCPRVYRGWNRNLLWCTCKYQLGINIGIEGCDTIRLGIYTWHIPLLISEFNADTYTTLVRILAGECTKLERLMYSCIMRNFKGWLVRYFLLLDVWVFKK